MSTARETDGLTSSPQIELHKAAMCQSHSLSINCTQFFTQQVF